MIKIVSKEKHIDLSDKFFKRAEQFINSKEYECIALATESLLASLDHLIDAHLSYLGTWTAGRKERYDRFSREAIESDVYIQSESDRDLIKKTYRKIFI
ncbi:MAG: hypothetical protein ACE5KE_09690 [Methanosarcinales archaeon]